MPRAPKAPLPKRDAATAPSAVRLEPPRAHGAPRPPSVAPPKAEKAEAFLSSLARKPPAAPPATQVDEHAAAAEPAAPPAHAKLPELESLRAAVAKPLGTKVALSTVVTPEGEATLPAKAFPSSEAPAPAKLDLEEAPLDPAPGAELETLPLSPANLAKASTHQNADSNASELETMPLATPVESPREAAPIEAEAQLEVSAHDIVKVESAPNAAEQVTQSAQAEGGEPAPTESEEPVGSDTAEVKGAANADPVLPESGEPAHDESAPRPRVPPVESELLTLSPGDLVTQLPDASAYSAPETSVAGAEAFRAGDYSVHGPASTPGFFPVQPRRALTSSDAPVELRRVEEGPSGRGEARRTRTALWAVSSVCAVLALALGLTVRALRARPLATAAVPQVAVPEKNSPPKAFECSVVAPAAKLSANMERGVEPTFSRLDDGRVAVGFASAPAEAQGIVVDLDTLNVTQAFAEKGDARVSQVNAATGQPPRFSVQREALDFASPRALETEPASALAVTKEAVVIRRGTDTNVLWPLPVGHGAEPRTARLGDGSYQLALRRGGGEGEILVGRLGPDGNSKGPLVPVETGVRLLGTPVVAANDKRAFVVFAGRDQKSDPFRLRAAALGAEAASVRAEGLRIAAAEGNGAIAPFLAPAGDDRWLLQWTQGEVGHYRVFVQSLSAELAPEGTPVAVSPMGANAGQGLVRSFGDKALSLFVLPVPGHDELWGAVLTCR